MRRPALALALALGACTPELPDPTSIVSTPRLLAARMTPAEVVPGATLESDALWVDPAGAATTAPLEWAFCSARKTFTEPGPVAAACLVEASDQLVVYGTGDRATGTVPSGACQQFGPDAPEPIPGEAPGRPVDPDRTGGYYQPVRVRVDAPAVTYALGQARIRCALPGATLAQTAEFRDRYVPNEHPAIDGVDVPTTVAAGDTVDLAVRWAACEAAPCTGSEPYLWFDPVSRQLTDRREAMRVSWFATAGAFASAHAGRSEEEAAQASVTGAWTAPDEPGVVTLWFVLRDDRGGVTWTSARVTVE